MLIKDMNGCCEFIAGDGTVLRELFHPGKAEVAFRYSLAHARVEPGQISRKHRLKVSEVYYILEGCGTMYINDESEAVCSGQAVYIPPDAVQCIENTGETDLTFLCIVDPAWSREDEVVL